MGISLSAAPVIASLLNNRSSRVFKSANFCKSWYIIFYLLMKVSMFLVMCLSIFRTVAMVQPFYNIHGHDKTIIPGTLSYLAFLLVVDTVYLATNLFKIRYRPALSFCEMQPVLNVTSGNILADLHSSLELAEVLIPSVIAFVCFIITVVSLARSRNTPIGKDKQAKQFRRITTTIAIFTAVFLVCNLPHFVTQLLYLTTGFQGNLFRTRIIKNTRLWQKYGHFTSVFLLTLLNSALNPCLYLARMHQFRSWLKCTISKCLCWRSCSDKKKVGEGSSDKITTETAT